MDLDSVLSELEVEIRPLQHSPLGKETGLRALPYALGEEIRPLLDEFLCYESDTRLNSYRSRPVSHFKAINALMSSVYLIGCEFLKIFYFVILTI